MTNYKTQTTRQKKKKKKKKKKKENFVLAERQISIFHQILNSNTMKRPLRSPFDKECACKCTFLIKYKVLQIENLKLHLNFMKSSAAGHR